MAAQELLKIQEVVKTHLCPVSMTYLKRLINNGEEQKKGTLRSWVNYIIATNIGLGKKRARWAISREELEAWQQRSKNIIS